MVYTDFNSGHLRALFRLYFIVVLMVLGLVGSQCCRCATKLDLINGKSVKLHRMTGWVRAQDVLTYIWKLRRLPGGWWLGLMMVTASALTLVADLAVALFVKQTYRWDLCEFDEGLVVDSPGSDDFVSPPSNGYPALIAMNAQISASINGCGYGIYEKVPMEDDPQICPKDKEILGYWECIDVQRDATIPADYVTEDIEAYLYSNGLQYAPDPAYTDIKDGRNYTTHYAAWSSSIDTLGMFGVLASVDFNASVNDTKTIRTYNCTISPDSNDFQTVSNILTQMDSSAALLEWETRLEGAIYRGSDSIADPDAGEDIAQLLNSMTMVQGGSNNVFREATGIPYYGCVKLKTTISPVVLILAAFAALILFLTTFYWIYLLMRLGKHALPSVFHRHATGLRGLRPVPDSIMSWMLQASRESALGGNSGDTYDPAYLAGVPRKERDLQNWSFAVTDADNGVARMVRTQGTRAPQVGHVYMTVDQK